MENNVQNENLLTIVKCIIRYLTQNDHNHPSFICYIEAVNNVYNSRKHWKQ